MGPWGKRSKSQRSVNISQIQSISSPAKNAFYRAQRGPNQRFVRRKLAPEFFRHSHSVVLSSRRSNFSSTPLSLSRPKIFKKQYQEISLQNLKTSKKSILLEPHRDSMFTMPYRTPSPSLIQSHSVFRQPPAQSPGRHKLKELMAKMGKKRTELPQKRQRKMVLSQSMRNLPSIPSILGPMQQANPSFTNNEFTTLTPKPGTTEPSVMRLSSNIHISPLNSVKISQQKIPDFSPYAEGLNISKFNQITQDFFENPITDKLGLSKGNHEAVEKISVMPKNEDEFNIGGQYDDGISGSLKFNIFSLFKQEKKFLKNKGKNLNNLNGRDGTILTAKKEKRFNQQPQSSKHVKNLREKVINLRQKLKKVESEIEEILDSKFYELEENGERPQIQTYREKENFTSPCSSRKKFGSSRQSKSQRQLGSVLHRNLSLNTIDLEMSELTTNVEEPLLKENKRNRRLLQTKYDKIYQRQRTSNRSETGKVSYEDLLRRNKRLKVKERISKGKLRKNLEKRIGELKDISKKQITMEIKLLELRYSNNAILIKKDLSEYVEQLKRRNVELKGSKVMGLAF